MSKQGKKSIVKLLSEDDRFNLEVIEHDFGISQHAEGSFGNTIYFTKSVGIVIGERFNNIEQLFALEPLAESFLFEDWKSFVVKQDNIDEFFGFLKESQDFAIREAEILERIEREADREAEILERVEREAEREIARL